MLKFMSAIMSAAAIAGGVTFASAPSTKFDANPAAKEAVVQLSANDPSPDSIVLVQDRLDIRECRLLTTDNLTPGAYLLPTSVFEAQSILLTQSQMQDWQVW
jgi:hypothetical protein